MNYFVYVIRSLEGYYYNTMTEDFKRRLSGHNNKTKSFWTKRVTKWEMIYLENASISNDSEKF